VETRFLGLGFNGILVSGVTIFGIHSIYETFDSYFASSLIPLGILMFIILLLGLFSIFLGIFVWKKTKTTNFDHSKITPIEILFPGLKRSIVIKWRNFGISIGVIGNMFTLLFSIERIIDDHTLVVKHLASLVGSLLSLVGLSAIGYWIARQNREASVTSQRRNNS